MLAPFAPFIIQFTQQLGDWFEFFKGVKDATDIKELFKGATKKDFQQVSQIVEPVAKDGGSQINLIASQGGVIIVNAPLTSVEANAVQNGLRRRIEAIPETLSGGPSRPGPLLVSGAGRPRREAGRQGRDREVFQKARQSPLLLR